ncbi:beta-lactamase family protein [Polaribacter sp.]|nr:beta-lactamase family protein [Polaribacter sp.]
MNKTIINSAILFLIIVTLFSCEKRNNEVEDATNPEDFTVYFPSNTTTTWETIATEDLGWNTNEVENLNSFLENSGTKGFIVLYKGRVVIEEYYNDHDALKNWYWASAGKTLTTAVVGIAQEEGFLSINDKVSDYLGLGWTSLTEEKENLITIKHLLSMSSGLDDTQGDATDSENLIYTADAGTRWAYHNVYVLLQDVVANATNETWRNYLNDKLRDKIGMSGTFIALGSLNVFWSNTRSMARFGLLTASNGNWDNTQIISENYITEATSASQNINLSYGYLWWLNGKESYHLPQSQLTFQGSLIPNAPDDMYCALGKNDQKIYIVPSKDLVIVRMGETGAEENFALSSYDDDLWERINAVID